jgi:geranylgeranyl diphosphate synthase type I
MPLDKFIGIMRPVIEEEMIRYVTMANGAGLQDLYDILTYHLGWEGEGAGEKASGKRIRPLIVLITTEAAGGDWENALPAAVAVELVHNFSLIHDDIQDNSPLRRGRPTVWKKWGIPQAINAGDSMFAIAHMALHDIRKKVPPETALKAALLLPQTCLALTQGQFLDLDYEVRGDLNIKAYWPMVKGKTAALLAACTQLGALVAGVDEDQLPNYRKFGEYLGLAFQVQDDLLGIWGDSSLTGKSTHSDLGSGKKSLPVLFSLELNDEFAKLWQRESKDPDVIASLATQLELDGARVYSNDVAKQLTSQALEALNQTSAKGEAKEALVYLATNLLKRVG